MKNKVKMNFIILISDVAVSKVGLVLNVCNSRSFSFFESYRRKFILTEVELVVKHLISLETDSC